MIEQRKFKIHPAILKSVILQQAGTLEKAFMELLMNAVDAGATRIDITLKANYFEVKDDGKGFKNKQEIEDFFETFGTPHEDGDAHYGRFRMGRGQIMPFAKTTWRSNKYSMTTDLLNTKDDLGFELKEFDEKIDGCIVSGTLYDSIVKNNAVSHERKLIYTIPKNVKFMPIPIFLNGKQINVDPKEMLWDFETDEAYFKINKDSYEIHLYNLGVFVSTKDSYNYYGIGGTIVSKKQLNVNFARNDVISYECDVYKKIEEKLQEIIDAKHKKSKQLNFSEKKFFIEQFKYLDIDISEFRNKYVFSLLNNKSLCLNDFSATQKNRTRIAIADDFNKNEAEYCLKKNLVTVFKREILDLFEVEDLEGLIASLKFVLQEHLHESYMDRSKTYSINRYLEWLDNVEIINLFDYTSLIDSEHKLLKSNELTDKERVILNVIKQKNRAISKLASSITKEPIAIRHIFIGDSYSYDGWTDSNTFIAINRRVLSNADFGVTGFTKILNIILHEYLHTSFNTSESHPHDLEFYENFHNATINIPQNKSIAEFARASTKNYYNVLIEKKMKVSKKVHQDGIYVQTLYDNNAIKNFFERINYNKGKSSFIENIAEIDDIKILDLLWLEDTDKGEYYTPSSSFLNAVYYRKRYFQIKQRIEYKLFECDIYKYGINLESINSFIDFITLNDKYYLLMKELKKGTKCNLAPFVEEFKNTYMDTKSTPLLTYIQTRYEYFVSVMSQDEIDKELEKFY